MPNEHGLTDNDVIDLLADIADHVDYPPIPDFSASFRRQSGRSGKTSAALRFPAASVEPVAIGDVTGTSTGEWTGSSRAVTGWRHAARLVAAGAALLIVGLVVVISLREARDGSNPAATTGDPEVRDVLITTFSDSTGADDYYSYLLVRDAETLESIYTIPVDLGGWFTISPDGTRLYAAGDRYLTAIDTRTGGVVWEVPIFGRHLRDLGIPGMGEPAVSPDGSRLYLYGTETGFTYWIEELDAASGKKLRVSEPSPNPSRGCNAHMYPSPDGKSLYLPCSNERIAILDLESMKWTDPLELAPLTPARLDAAQPGDGELLYVATVKGEIAVVDMNSRRVADTARFFDQSEEDQNWIIARATVSDDGETLAVILTDEVVRGPIVERQYRLYDVGSWEEVKRVTLEKPITPGGVTPDNSGGFLIVEEDKDGDLEALRLDRSGLAELGYSLGDGSDGNYYRTGTATIATGESAKLVCPITPETAGEGVRERFGFGQRRTVEAAGMYVNFWGAPTEGDGIGYTAKMDYPDGYEEAGWYYITLQLVVPIERNVGVSGYRLDGPGDLRFGETDEPDVTREVGPSPGMEAMGLGELRRIDARVQGPGCYGMVIRWDDSYETIFFEVID